MDSKLDLKTSEITTVDGDKVESTSIQCEASDDCVLPIDMILRSSDGTRFGTHKTNLQSYSSILATLHEAASGLPNADSNSEAQKLKAFDPEDESTDFHLPEDSDVIQLLLKFMHYQPQPDLRLISSNLLLRLANVAEKYKVYCATTVCSIVLELSVKEHSFDVFLYATKWGYKGLQEVAAKLAMKESPAKFFAYAHSINHIEWRDLAEQETHKLPTKKVYTSLKEYCAKDSGMWAQLFGAWFNKRETLRVALFTAITNPGTVQHKGGAAHCDEWHTFYPQLLSKMAVEPPCEETFRTQLNSLKPLLKNCEHCGIVLKTMTGKVHSGMELVAKRPLKEFL